MTPNWQKMYNNAVQAVEERGEEAKAFKRCVLKEYITRVSYRKYISRKPKDARLIDLYQCEKLGHIREEGNNKCIVCKYG